MLSSFVLLNQTNQDLKNISYFRIEGFDCIDHVIQTSEVKQATRTIYRKRFADLGFGSIHTLAEIIRGKGY